MIMDFLTELVDVYRLQVVNNEDDEPTNKKSYGLLHSNLKCLIQAYDSDITQDNAVQFGKSFLMFCEISDIVEMDRIFRDPDGINEEYRIVGVKTYADLGPNSHMEILIRAFKS